MAQLNFTIPDHLLQKVDAAKPEYLDRKGFLCLLIDQALEGGLTNDPTTQTMGEPAARRASNNTVVKESSNSSSKDSRNKDVGQIPEELEAHDDLIKDFWRVKKGSKGAIAWKLLMGELEKIRSKYGSAVVTEQLQLAINGKWQGIQLKNYEQFLPKSATAAQTKGGSNLQRLPNGEVDWNHYQDLSFFPSAK